VLNPMRGLYACTTRALPSDRSDTIRGVPADALGTAPASAPNGSWQPQERISVEDCIRNYTTGSAYAEFAETRKGQLRPGQYADFIILSADMTRVPPAQYTSIKVLRTVVAGRTVYQIPQ